MNILVVGGTQFVGVHLVRNLIAAGHNVTVATRGLTADQFGDTVHRVVLERTDRQSIRDALGNSRFEVVFDTQAYSSNEIKFLLDVIRTDRYVEVSTLSVYRRDLHDGIEEKEFDPLQYPLNWCNRDAHPYDEIKRQAECAIFQRYHDTPAVAVRFPFIVGTDDYTRRLRFYVEHIVKSFPMFVNNLDSRLAFVNSTEAGLFLAWLTDSSLVGPVNAASYENISIREIIEYVEDKVGTTSILSSAGEPAPYNDVPSYSLDLSKSQRFGFTFSVLDSWFPALLDALIVEVKRELNN